MISTKAAVIGVVVVLLALGGGVFWLTRPTAPATNTPVIPVDSSGYTAPVGVTSGNTIKAPDIDKQYQQIFATLSAQKVVFTPVGSSAEEGWGKIYDLYADDIESSMKLSPDAGTYILHAALVDLNADGVEEVLVYEDLPGFCGSAGCPFGVYTLEGTAWKRVLSVLSGDTIGVTQAKTQGFSDLLVVAGVTSDGSVPMTRYSWDGKQYAEGGVVATWNGSSFAPFR